MSTIDDGLPAFPITVDNSERLKGAPGMTLRDYFASAAMQGWMATYSGESVHPASIDDGAPQVIAALSYVMADAMLAERSKQ